MLMYASYAYHLCTHLRRSNTLFQLVPQTTHICTSMQVKHLAGPHQVACVCMDIISRMHGVCNLLINKCLCEEGMTM